MFAFLTCVSSAGHREQGNLSTEISELEIDAILHGGRSGMVDAIYIQSEASLEPESYRDALRLEQGMQSFTYLRELGIVSVKVASSGTPYAVEPMPVPSREALLAKIGDYISGKNYKYDGDLQMQSLLHIYDVNLLLSQNDELVQSRRQTRPLTGDVYFNHVRTPSIEHDVFASYRNPIFIHTFRLDDAPLELTIAHDEVDVLRVIQEWDDYPAILDEHKTRFRDRMTSLWSVYQAQYTRYAQFLYSKCDDPVMQPDFTTPMATRVYVDSVRNLRRQNLHMYNLFLIPYPSATDHLFNIFIFDPEMRANECELVTGKSQESFESAFDAFVFFNETFLREHDLEELNRNCNGRDLVLRPQ